DGQRGGPALMALKVGTEDKKKVAIVAALGVVVLGLVIYNVIGMFSGGSTPTPAPAPVVATAPATPQASQTVAAPSAPGGVRVVPAKRTKEATKIPGSMANLDPTLHPELMAQAESLEYSGKGRNIFSMSSAPQIEVAQAPARPEPVAPQGPVGPPPPPPI